MTNHRTYGTIVGAVKKGKLKEPFSKKDVLRACPTLKKNTICTFLTKHRKENPGLDSELFIKTSLGKFKLIRPFKYGF